MSKKESFLGLENLGDDIEMKHTRVMANGKVVKEGQMDFDDIPDMPKAKTFDEFCAFLTKFLAVNKVEFAIYIGSIGVLPKDKQSGIAMFSEDSDDEENTVKQFAKLAVMFHQLCENKHRDLREELEHFVGAVMFADVKSGGDALNDGSED